MILDYDIHFSDGEWRGEVFDCVTAQTFYVTTAHDRADVEASCNAQIAAMEETYIECGCCGAYHRSSWYGDCRDDTERFADIPPYAGIVPEDTAP